MRFRRRARGSAGYARSARAWPRSRPKPPPTAHLQVGERRHATRGRRRARRRAPAPTAAHRRRRRRRRGSSTRDASAKTKPPKRSLLQRSPDPPVVRAQRVKASAVPGGRSKIGRLPGTQIPPRLEEARPSRASLAKRLGRRTLRPRPPPSSGSGAARDVRRRPPAPPPPRRAPASARTGTRRPLAPRRASEGAWRSRRRAREGAAVPAAPGDEPGDVRGRDENHARNSCGATPGARRARHARGARISGGGGAITGADAPPRTASPVTASGAVPGARLHVFPGARREWYRWRHRELGRQAPARGGAARHHHIRHGPYPAHAREVLVLDFAARASSSNAPSVRPSATGSAPRSQTGVAVRLFVFEHSRAGACARSRSRKTRRARGDRARVRA